MYSTSVLLKLQPSGHVFDVKKAGPPSNPASSRKLIIAEDNLVKKFKYWKRAGKPKSKDDPL
jgi:hypothetical protein